jgi:hypothetical protein
MSLWGDVELLVELLDRQFQFLDELEGTDRIRRLPRLHLFIETEPRIAALLVDFKREANGRTSPRARFA